jgi:hypothetical protein
VSLRQKVDRERIKLFFQSLANRFRRPGKIYLVGGTSLVFEELRLQTVDIDVVIEVSPADHGKLIQAIRELKDELSINVEEASPGDFIPLPSGYQNRHEYLERIGTIDVLHFDLYSTALSKIERGREQDLVDVLALLRVGRIEWTTLVDLFKEILPRMGKESLKQDPIEFEQNFRALEAMWHSLPK